MTFDTRAARLAALSILLFACSDTSGPSTDPDDPTAIVVLAGNGQKRALGAQLVDSLAVRVLDGAGDPASGVSVSWTVASGDAVISPATTSTGGDGTARTSVTVGSQTGTITIHAAVDGLSPATFTVQAVPAPVVTGASPDSMPVRGHLIIDGSGFSSVPAENVVRIGGVPATVQAAQPTRLTVIVPCLPTGEVGVDLEVFGATAAFTHPLRVTDRRNLAVGDSYALDGPDAHCTELLSAGTFMAVVSSVGQPAGTTAVRFTGSVPGAGAPVQFSFDQALRVRPAPEFDRRRRAHDRILRHDAELLRVPRPPRAALRDPSAAMAAVPNVGDILTLKVPDAANGNTCFGVAATVSARVVHVGTHAVVLEDINAPLAGTMDAMFQAMGQTFDNDMFPLLTANFGNPLAIDGSTDANGRIYMLFTPAINDMQSLAGFVTPADLLSDICPAGNKAEIFYATVPTLPGDEDDADGLGNVTAAHWFRVMRTVVMHEAKHIASFAELLSRGTLLAQDALWMEESTAMIAEELYARAAHGYAQHGNTTFQASLFCERRPTLPECAGRPFAMYDHFYYVYNYLASIETRSPLYAVATDPTFYGSGWSFLRWVIDHYASSESALLRALTTEAVLDPFSSIEARAGRPFEELLGDWLLAHALDDHPEYAVDALYTMPSWNTPDIFLGMNQDVFPVDEENPHPFPDPTPLRMHSVAGGNFLVDLAALRGGTGAIMEFTGAASVARLLKLTTPAGGPASGSLRLKVLRVK